METNQTRQGWAAYAGRHKRFGIILIGIVLLNIAFGFDARFTLINLLWIAVSLVKIDA